jgi:hypothetical protein
MAGWEDGFLPDLDPKRWETPREAPKSLTPSLLFLGQGDQPLEVALTSCAGRPKAEDVRKMWTARKGHRASPLLLVTGYPENGVTTLAVCGPAGENPILIYGLALSQVERLAAAALSEPSRHAAVRFLVPMLPEATSDLPGLRNSGLLATQELRNGVPARPDWAKATTAGKLLLSLAGRDLVEGLGFSVTNLSVNSSVLTVGDGIKRAVAIFLDEGETFDDAAERFQGTSPVSQALAQADRENLPWVVLTRGRQIRLYAARPDTGVGRKGRAETFVEVNLALLPEDKAGYLPLLFGAEALIESGTIEEILESSADFAADLAARLRERVYNETVPRLAEAVASRLGDTSKLTDEDLAYAYEQTLVILFRLLFVAYAEDKDLLPYHSNSKYAGHSLKHIARQMAEDRQTGTQQFDEQARGLWEDVRQLWQAVDRGNKSWGVPSYNGGLFSDYPEVSAAGAALAKIQLNDTEFGPALAAMLVDEGADGVVGPVDFRSLSVREFGTIYEGLLESMLSIAPSNLTTDAKGNYVPTTRKSDKVLVKEGDVYFHNRSGARKATGSYFTKSFAVKHLLDYALEPALDDHLERLQQHLDAGDQTAAADAFFDFRCVDLAMGSGHFLVAAVDRIEARLSTFLALHPIPAINAELGIFRRAALDALGDLADGVEIETTSLLRRQVARRCIYGVDINPISVELARLSIWIHTFVPGLPLSFLDHSLVCGNSLTGIGTLDEALDVLDPDHGKGGQVSLFRADIEGFLNRASQALQRLAHITETSTSDIKEARRAHHEALAAVDPARQLFDLLLAVRLGEAPCPVTLDERGIAKAPGVAKGKKLATELQALHFPTVFPEVFIRERPGFDCILGNPPWEEATVEELGFFTLRHPGLKSLSQAEQKHEIKKLRASRPDLVAEYDAAVAKAEALRRVLLAGPYPGMGSGDPDLYKAFCWRFWSLTRTEGAIGVVLPRSALSANGSAPWRLEVLDHGAFQEVTMILNNSQWFFEDVHPQYTIGLVAIRKGDDRKGAIALRGPYASLASYLQGQNRLPILFPASDFKGWSDGASFPLIPSAEAADVFRKIRAHPRLDANNTGWACRPVTEFHATNDKWLFELDPPDTEGLWPVYKGASFNLWEPDTGVRYAWAVPDEITNELQQRRAKAQHSAKSAFSEFTRAWAADPDTLPCWHPRIAFRDVTNRTNQRTVIACLVYPQIIITNQAPYLLWPKGDQRDQAYLLGVLCSIPLDWYARRVVETHVNFHLFNAFPVPRPDRDNPVRLEVEQAAARLAAVDDWFKPWAKAVGVPVASVVDGEEYDSLVARIDAAVALLYGLDEADIGVIFETFHTGWDHRARLENVLQQYKDLR